jgi:hypothetical protein
LDRSRRRQLASAPHFEIWYAYPTGHSPSLNQMINEMLARDGALTEANIDHIHKTFISPTASPTASTISGPSQRRDRAGHGHDRRRTSGAQSRSASPRWARATVRVRRSNAPTSASMRPSAAAAIACSARPIPTRPATPPPRSRRRTSIRAFAFDPLPTPRGAPPPAPRAPTRQASRDHHRGGPACADKTSPRACRLGSCR